MKRYKVEDLDSGFKTSYLALDPALEGIKAFRCAVQLLVSA